MTVSVRELNQRLTGYLQRAHLGERVVITRRGKPYVVIGPAKPERVDVPKGLEDVAKRLRGLSGVVWNGTNLNDLPLSAPVKLRGTGPTISEMIIQARRSRW